MDDAPLTDAEIDRVIQAHHDAELVAFTSEKPESVRYIHMMSERALRQLQAEILRLRALVREWRPIAEAPRDGTAMLVARSRNDGKKVVTTERYDLWLPNPWVRSATAFQPLPRHPEDDAAGGGGFAEKEKKE